MRCEPDGVIEPGHCVDQHRRQILTACRSADLDLLDQGAQYAGAIRDDGWRRAILEAVLWSSLTNRSCPQDPPQRN